MKTKLTTASAKFYATGTSQGVEEASAAASERAKKERRAVRKVTSGGEDDGDAALRFIGKPEVLHRVNLSYPTVWKMMLAGTFPRARNIGGKNAWIASEIAAWIKDRPIVTLKGEAGPTRATMGGFSDPPYRGRGRPARVKS